MIPDPRLVDRFRDDLALLAPAGARIGVGVSGGPDSLALLLLAASALPESIEAATVDHAFRPESADEARAVADICAQLNVPHTTLTARWTEPPITGMQARARDERYALLAGWAMDCGLDAILTAHHADDQAETVLMRLNRGAGVTGLAGMRTSARVPGADVRLLRPLLHWRRAELNAICEAAGLSAAADPSNEDPRFERVRVRKALAQAEWLNADSITRSAAFLAEADEALVWAMEMEWQRAVAASEDRIAYTPTDAPNEVRRRIVAKAIGLLGAEGEPERLRGLELERLVSALERGETASLRGVRCSGGKQWDFSRNPPRRG